MKDIIHYAYYVTSALNLYEINDSPNFSLRYCMCNELFKFLFKKNIFFAELNIFENLKILLINQK